MPKYDDYVLLRLTDVPPISEDMDPDEAAKSRQNFLLAVQTVGDKYLDKSEPYLCVHELGKDENNPHIHWTFKLIGNMQALRQALYRFGFKGNETYCLKAAIPDKMERHFRYLCKGSGTGKEDGPKIMFSHEYFTDAVVEELHQAYWKEANQVNPRIKRKRETPAGQQILEICRQRGAPNTHLEEDDVINITLEWYRTNKFQINTFQVKAVINWVMLNLYPDSNRVHLMKQALKFN